MTFTGDIPSIAASLELQSQKAAFPCSFCKIQKISHKAGEAPLSFNNLEDNPMVTSDELRDLALRAEFSTQGNIWKLKGDNMFTVFTGFDFITRSDACCFREHIFKKDMCIIVEKESFQEFRQEFI